MSGVWDRIDVRRPDDCWPWTGTVNAYGYGIYGKANTFVHRIAYIDRVGQIPPGLTIDHLCRTRLCCNPAHLEAVTRGENVMRGESPPARNARKTECTNGHPFNDANTYYRKDRAGRRQCRACDRERRRSAA